MANLPFKGHFQSMSALGRLFQLGDLYDYHHDQILSAGNSVNVTLVIRFHTTFVMPC